MTTSPRRTSLRTLAVTVLALAAWPVASAAAMAPVNITPPVIVGTPEVGETLTCSSGTWLGAESYSYEWLDLLSGSRGTNAEPTYVVAPGDDMLACIETASDSSGNTGTAGSPPVMVRPSSDDGSEPPPDEGTPDDDPPPPETADPLPVSTTFPDGSSATVTCPAGYYAASGTVTPGHPDNLVGVSQAADFNGPDGEPLSWFGSTVKTRGTANGTSTLTVNCEELPTEGTTPPDNDDGTTPPDNGGTTPPDDDGGSGSAPPDDNGGTTPPDDDGGSGSAPPDDNDGTTPPDDDGGSGSAPPDDNDGTTPPDNGGTTPPDDDGGAGSTPPDDNDGTTPPDNGGTTPPDDDGGAGSTLPDDNGGTTPPDDDGAAPPDDKGDSGQDADDTGKDPGTKPPVPVVITKPHPTDRDSCVLDGGNSFGDGAAIVRWRWVKAANGKVLGRNRKLVTRCRPGKVIIIDLTVWDELDRGATTRIKLRSPRKPRTTKRERKRPARKVKVVLNANVLFGVGRATLDPEGRKTVTQLRKHLRRASRVVIAGHADSAGPARFNRRLSRKRAVTVRRALLRGNKGRPGDIVVRWFGESRPRKSNRTRKGRAQNRRVGVTITYRALAPKRSNSRRREGRSCAAAFSRTSCA